MDRSSILRASTKSYKQVGKRTYLLFYYLSDTAENRTLCRARALSKREAFVASGRGRRQAAEAGADLRSKYADSPRKLSTRYGCDADRASCPGPNPSTDPPYRGESNSVQGAGVKQARSVCSERARTPAGGRSRCVFAQANTRILRAKPRPKTDAMSINCQQPMPPLRRKP